MGQVVSENTSCSLLFTNWHMLDILIVTVINWIMRAIIGQVVCATEATHISLMCFCCDIGNKFRVHVPLNL